MRRSTENSSASGRNIRTGSRSFGTRISWPAGRRATGRLMARRLGLVRTVQGVTPSGPAPPGRGRPVGPVHHGRRHGSEPPSTSRATRGGESSGSWPGSSGASSHIKVGGSFVVSGSAPAECARETDRKGARGRVLYVVPTSFRLEHHLDGRLAYLVDRGFEVEVACQLNDRSRRAAGREGVPLAPMLRPEVRPLRDLVSLWTLGRRLIRSRIDVVNCSTKKGGLYGTILGRLSRPIVDGLCRLWNQPQLAGTPQGGVVRLHRVGDMSPGRPSGVPEPEHTRFVPG